MVYAGEGETVNRSRKTMTHLAAVVCTAQLRYDEVRSSEDTANRFDEDDVPWPCCLADPSVYSGSAISIGQKDCQAFVRCFAGIAGKTNSC